jgi:hypothetical protein
MITRLGHQQIERDGGQIVGDRVGLRLEQARPARCGR